MNCTVFVYSLGVETGKVSYDRGITSAHGRCMDAFIFIFLIITSVPFVLEIIEFKALYNKGCFHYEDYATECLKGFLLRVNAAKKKILLNLLCHPCFTEAFQSH